MDSLAFLQSSLANVTNSLYANGKGLDKFDIVRAEFKQEILKGVSEKNLFGKLLFPYNSLTCFNDLMRTDFLEPKNFYND